VARTVGRVEALWRYPVKSLRGEQIQDAEVTAVGFAGDRAYAFRDRATGRIMSAKRWARLFELGARYPDGPAGEPEITLPDGSRVGTENASAAVSAWLGHDVELIQTAVDAMHEYAIAIQTVEDIEAGVDQLAVDAGDFPCPPGSFFDAASLHLITDATLAALSAAHPAGQFDARRFRPNVLIETGAPPAPLEEEWAGRTLALGGQVRASVLMTTIRCVMTTLPQFDLPRDPKILRTLAQGFGGNAGVYANVELRGRVRVGDPVAVV
jgi:uncharacterized protein YcbX